MNSRQLLKLGVPADCIREAMSAIESATRAGNLKGKAVKKLVQQVLEDPASHVVDEHFGAFARSVVAERDFVPPAAGFVPDLGS